MSFPPTPDDWFPDEDLIVSDRDLRQHLTAIGLDPVTEPYPCAQAVVRRWNLPVLVAQNMISNLR